MNGAGVVARNCWSCSLVDAYHFVLFEFSNFYFLFLGVILVHRKSDRD